MHSNHEVHFALCMLCDIGYSLHIRSTLTRTIYELVPCRKRQRLNLTFSLLCRLSSKPSPKSRMTVSTALSHVEAQFPIQGNSRPMMRLARSSFPRSCASERPKGARTNIGGRKQAHVRLDRVSNDGYKSCRGLRIYSQALLCNSASCRRRVRALRSLSDLSLALSSNATTLNHLIRLRGSQGIQIWKQRTVPSRILSSGKAVEPFCRARRSVNPFRSAIPFWGLITWN